MAWWIVASVWAAEPAFAQRSAVTIVSSRGGEKVTVKVDPIPTGELVVQVSLVDPNGNRTPLPPVRTGADAASGHVTGPALPVEMKGYWVDVEITDAATGRSLGGTGSWVL